MKPQCPLSCAVLKKWDHAICVYYSSINYKSIQGSYRRIVWTTKTTSQNTLWTLSLRLQTWQVHHRLDLHMAWTLLNTDAAVLRVFKRKVLLKFLSPVRVGEDFRIQYNSKLYELLNDLDVVQRINIQWLHWLGMLFEWTRMLRWHG